MIQEQINCTSISLATLLIILMIAVTLEGERSLSGTANTRGLAFNSDGSGINNT